MAPGKQTMSSPTEIPQLSSLDVHFLSASKGWRGLGNLTEAREELRKVSPASRQHPDVRFAWVEWLIQRGHFDSAYMQCLMLACDFPKKPEYWIALALAARHMEGGGLQFAYDRLLSAHKRLPLDATIVLKLAGYACALGELVQACTWFKMACILADYRTVIAMAFEDPDFEAILPEVARYRFGYG